MASYAAITYTPTAPPPPTHGVCWKVTDLGLFKASNHALLLPFLALQILLHPFFFPSAFPPQIEHEGPEAQ